MGGFGAHSRLGDIAMLGDRVISVARTRRRFCVLTLVGACALALICTGVVAFEEAQRPPPSDPGLFGTIGRFVDDTLAGVTSGFGTARGHMDEAATRATDTAKDAAKGAADAAEKVARIPLTSVVAGRQRCVPAPNGAPDCQVATDALCRGRGFTTGRSVDVQSAQKCPPAVWISGRQPTEGECTTETYVTRAMCQ